MILKNDKKDIRKIITTRGVLSISRTVLRPIDSGGLEILMREEQKKCVVPLDVTLGIDVLPFKMTREMMCEVAFWAQNQCSFKASGAILKKVHGTGIAADTVRRIADYVGKRVFEEDTRQADFLYRTMAGLKISNDKEGILYIQADGAALNTRHKNADGSTWRENKLGMVFSSDNVRTHRNKKGEPVHTIQKKEYTSYVGSAREFKKYLFACAVKNGYGSYKKTVVLSDGATWIRSMCEELFPDAIQILDLFHLCENTYEYAKGIFKNDEAKYKPWAEDICSKFRNGQKSEAIQILRDLQRRKLPKGCVNLLTYVTNNINKIDYKEYSEEGYYVGSGAIESGNKVVLQKRLKLAGMRWNEETAQYLLTLRAKFESELWARDVVSTIINADFAPGTEETT